MSRVHKNTRNENPYNVKQHFMSAHPTKPISFLTLEKMHNAAQSYSEKQIHCTDNVDQREEENSLSSEYSIASGESSARDISNDNFESLDCVETISNDGKEKNEVEDEVKKINGSENNQEGEIFEGISERSSIPSECKIAEKWLFSVSHNAYDTGIPAKVELNCIVEVFSAKDLAWRRGTVTNISTARTDDSSRNVFSVLVLCDDGEKEDISNIVRRRSRMIYGHRSATEVTWEKTLIFRVITWQRWKLRTLWRKRQWNYRVPSQRPPSSDRRRLQCLPHLVCRTLITNLKFQSGNNI